MLRYLFRAADSTFLRTICNGARTQGVTLFSVGVKHYNINQLRVRLIFNFHLNSLLIKSAILLLYI